MLQSVNQIFTSENLRGCLFSIWKMNLEECDIFLSQENDIGTDGLENVNTDISNQTFWKQRRNTQYDWIHNSLK